MLQKVQNRINASVTARKWILLLFIAVATLCAGSIATKYFFSSTHDILIPLAVFMMLFAWEAHVINRDGAKRPVQLPLVALAVLGLLMLILSFFQ